MALAMLCTNLRLHGVRKANAKCKNYEELNKMSNERRRGKYDFIHIYIYNIKLIIAYCLHKHYL